MRLPTMRLSMTMTAVLLSIPSVSPDLIAQEAPNPQKPVVMASADVTLRDDSGAIVPRRFLYATYRIEEIAGDRVRVVSAADPNERGWVLRSETVEKDRAEPYFSERIRTAPDAYAYLMRSTDLLKLMRDPKARTARLDDLTRAIRLDPKSWYARRQRGTAQYFSEAYPEALDDLEEAVRLLPPSPTDRAEVLHWRGHALAGLGQYDRAIADYEEMRRLDPTTGDVALVGLARVRAAKGDLDGAIGICTDMMAKNPKFFGYPRDRAFYQLEMGRPDEALADIEASLRLMPARSQQKADRARIHAARGEYRAALADFEDDARTRNHGSYYVPHLAFFLATCPDPAFRDGRRARELAEKEIETFGSTHPRRNRQSLVLDALAAAHAELGEFDRAVAREEQALALLIPNDRGRAALESRLALYRDKKPFRDDPKPR